MLTGEIPAGVLENSAELMRYFSELALRLAEEARQDQHDCDIQIGRLAPRGMSEEFYLGIVAAANLIGEALQNGQNYSKQVIKHLVWHMIAEAAQEFEARVFPPIARKQGNEHKQKHG